MLRVVLVIDDYNELIYLETVLKKLGFDVEGLQNPRKYSDVSLGFNPHIVMVSAQGKKINGLQLAQSIQRRRGLPKVIALVQSEARISPGEFEAAGVDQTLESPVNPKKLILAVAAAGDLDEQALLEKYQKIKSSGGIDTPGTTVAFDENGQPVDSVQVIRSELSKLNAEPESFAVSGGLDGANEDGDVRFPIQREERESNINVSSNSTKETAVPGYPMPDATAQDERRRRHEEWLKRMDVKVSGEHFQRDRILEFNKKIRGAPPVEDLDDIENERRSYVKALFERIRK